MRQGCRLCGAFSRPTKTASPGVLIGALRRQCFLQDYNVNNHRKLCQSSAQVSGQWSSPPTIKQIILLSGVNVVKVLFLIVY